MDPALTNISSEAAQIRKCIDSPGHVMASLRHATKMLAELRDQIPPKQYYYRYSACFDALSQLAAHLKDIHASHHLADIYEHVQYATYAVPRLYLMVTVGSAFMSIPDAPVTEILDDMLEMCRAVQTPLRGLFLRYYLVQRVREFLPQFENVNDAVKFIMTNFVEMNKLWVRMQHLGLSTEKDKRAAERRELQTIVGFNVERLAYLNLSMEYFRERVFPPLAQQIIHCRDPLAQEYLLDVICSAFPAEFHLGTLDAYLDTAGKLSPGTSLPKVLLLSIERLTKYVEEEMPTEAERVVDAHSEAQTEDQTSNDDAKADGQKEENTAEEAKDIPSQTEGDSKEPTETKSDTAEKDDSKRATTTESETETKSHDKDDEGETEEGSKSPKEVSPPSSPKSPSQGGSAEPIASPPPASGSESGEAKESETEIISKLFSVYKAHLETIKTRLNHPQRAQIANGLSRLAFLLDPNDLGRIHELLVFVEGDAAITDSATVELLLSLLEYMPLLDLIAFGTFKRLLSAQDRTGQQQVANKVLQAILKNSTAITDYNVAKQIFDLFGLIAKSGNMDTLHLSELVYLLQTDDPDEAINLLGLAHSSLRQGGVNVLQQTYGALVFAAAKLIRQHPNHDPIPALKFMNKAIHDLATIGSQPEKAFRLYAYAGIIADQCNAPEYSYDFYVQAFSIYEEHVSDSRAQYQSILILTGSLQKTRNLGNDNYDTLASKCAQYGQKLLKKADQCRAIYMAAHLWYVEEGDAIYYSNDSKVLETLQRALRVADGCMDTALSVELFVEVLNRFLYFLEREGGDVTERHVNGLIELINTNLTQSEDEGSSESPRKYFERTLAFIDSEKSNIPAFEKLVTGE